MNIEKIIEFDKIKEMWMELAVTDKAREQIANTSYLLEENELKKCLKDTTNSRKFIEKCGTPPLTSIDEVKEIMMRASKGECLNPYQLERIEKILIAIRRLKDYLIRGKQYENSLAYYEENLNDAKEVQEEISRKIRNGEVSDYASKQLLEIRGDIARYEEKMKQKVEQVIRANKDSMTDNYSTFRNGRLCIPVKKEYKWKIAGSVIDKSSTGNTLFIEPVSIAKMYEEIQELKIQEENEIYRILYVLTAMVADYELIMEENIRMMEKLDYIFSKGKLSLDMDAVEPEINLERKIELKNARHPLMDRNLNVPLQIQLNKEVKGIVITGPNTGGKTVAIKTVALNCFMAQSGLHVTCEEANICMNSAFLCDIGDGQNLSENLSTFSAHIKNVLEIIKEVDRDGLVIMDELGSGTDPTEGMGIAIAILEELRQSDCLFLVTTHYPEVKDYADKAETVVNARMEFDKETLKPTYQMVIGEAGESCAFYIAEKLGMSTKMLKTAIHAAYGEKAVEAYHLEGRDELVQKKKVSKIKKKKKVSNMVNLSEKYHIGDSVMIYPDKKIGIVCEPINEKGVLRVQLPNKKIWINHNRVKLHVAATELYPDDYDFSIIFDTVENRKIKHDMNRKYTKATIEYDI